MSNILSGISSLGYQGTNATNPPNLTYSTNNPTQYDSANFSLGDLWLNTANNSIWLLVSLMGTGTSGGSLATWVQLNISGVLNTITGNIGGAVPFDSSNNINLLGDGTTIVVTGNPATNTLTVAVAAGISIDTITGDTGGPVGPDGLGNINIVGTPNIITVSGNPGTNTLTIDTGSFIATQYDTDSGSAVPAGGVLNIVGGANINTSGAGNTVTVNLDTVITGITDLTVDNLTVTTSADFSYLTEGVLQSDGSGNITASKGTDGEVLISATAGAPAWATLTAGTNITINNGPNSITINASGGGGSSGLVFLDSRDMTGITSTAFTSLITSTYRSYLLVADQVTLSPKVSGGTLFIDVSQNNGATWFPGGCFASGIWYSLYNSATLSNTNTTGSFIPAVYFTSVADQYISFSYYLYDLPTTNTAKSAVGQFTTFANGTVYGGQAGGSYNGDLPGTPTCNLAPPIPPVTAIRFRGPAAFVAGTVELYGLVT